MKRQIIGTFSIILGTVLILDSLPGITGHIVSDQAGFSLFSFFGLVLLVCGLALFVLEMQEVEKKNKR